LTPYAGHGNIVQNVIDNTAGAAPAVDGTAPQVTVENPPGTPAWHSAAIAAWGAGSTNLKGWYQATPATNGLGMFGVTATASGSQATGDTTAAGTAGVFLCQEIGQIRNLLIRRY